MTEYDNPYKKYTSHILSYHYCSKTHFLVRNRHAYIATSRQFFYKCNPTLHLHSRSIYMNEYMSLKKDSVVGVEAEVDKLQDNNLETGVRDNWRLQDELELTTNFLQNLYIVFHCHNLANIRSNLPNYLYNNRLWSNNLVQGDSTNRHLLHIGLLELFAYHSHKYYYMVPKSMYN